MGPPWGRPAPSHRPAGDKPISMLSFEKMFRIWTLISETDPWPRGMLICGYRYKIEKAELLVSGPKANKGEMGQLTGSLYIQPLGPPWRPMGALWGPIGAHEAPMGPVVYVSGGACDP